MIPYEVPPENRKSGFCDCGRPATNKAPGSKQLDRCDRCRDWESTYHKNSVGLERSFKTHLAERQAAQGYLEKVYRVALAPLNRL